VLCFGEGRGDALGQKYSWLEFRVLRYKTSASSVECCGLYFVVSFSREVEIGSPLE